MSTHLTAETPVSNDTALEAKVLDLCELAVRMTTASGSGHPSSALSLAHIVTALMYRHMRFDPQSPRHSGSDRLVLSEGHAVPIVYAAYADLGGQIDGRGQRPRRMTADDLNMLRDVNSPLDGHPSPAEGVPFFDAATGSLGQGLSVGAGLALAARLSRIEKNIYVICGDGESREGQIAEALDFIIDHDLRNVLPIFNCNGEGQAEHVSSQQSAERLSAKLKAYGFDVYDVDGHKISELSACFARLGKNERPMALVARTVKGWGVSALRDGNHHGKPLPANKLDAAARELAEARSRLETLSDMARPSRPPAESPATAQLRKPATFENAIERAGYAKDLAKGNLATRKAYGAALLALGEADPRVVVLDGDVKNSTFTELFCNAYPHRFFEGKIAEQNMVSAAVGLAAGGYIPFANSFAKFLTRAYDQIELASISRANIKLVGSHSGVSLAADGPSQMSLQDVAYFRSMTRIDDGFGRPACVLFQPADARAAFQLTLLMAEHDGMCYMRTHRPDVPVLYDANAQFRLGGSHALRKGDALTIVASGYMVVVALAAADRLAEAGVSCNVFDAYCLPLDAEPILDAARSAGGTILTIEDNYGGGFHAELAEAAGLLVDVRVDGMFCRRIPRSARTAEDELAFVGLSVSDVVARAKLLADGR